MNVYDFLKTVDIEQIAKCYVARRNYDDGFDVASEEEITEVLNVFVPSLLDRTPIEDSEYIIVPTKHTDFGQEELYATLYKKADIVSFEPTVTMEEMEGNLKLVEDYDIDKLSELIDMTLPESYSYTFAPWEETLGYEVFLPNDDLDFVAAFAEDLLWEMSFNGYTEESQEERRQELFNMVDAAKEAIDEGNYRSGDEVVSEIREKYGIPDMRTPEEKEIAKRNLYRDLIESQIAITCSLLMCRALLIKNN